MTAWYNTFQIISVGKNACARLFLSQVYVGMFGDPLHAGHIDFLAIASQYGRVTVGLQTDESLDMEGVFDHDTEPLMRFNLRREVISNIKYVDKVVPQSYRTRGFLGNLEHLRSVCAIRMRAQGGGGSCFSVTPTRISMPCRTNKRTQASEEANKKAMNEPYATPRPDYLVHCESWNTALQGRIRERAIEVLSEWGGQLVEPCLTPEINTYEVLTRATLAVKMSEAADGEFQAAKEVGVGSRSRTLCPPLPRPP